ncbi:MAG: ceramidase domain-containing protein [Chitinophagales bacterium]|nr:ceramidase domain-containing protein [Chitinophagales bacterium]
MHKQKNIFLISCINAVLALIITVLIIVFQLFGEGTGVGSNFCEAAREGFIKQPINTYSNIGFMLAGLWVAYQSSFKINNNKNKFNNNILYPLFFANVLIVLGPCSMLMHATETFWGGYCDMLSMYLLASFMLAYGFSRYKNLSSIGFVLTFCLAMIFCNIMNFYGNDIFPIDFFVGNLAFGFICGLGVIFEVLHHYKHKTKIKIKYIYYCVVTFGVAFTIWQFGINDHCWCWKYSVFQWHGLWHLLCALATYFLYQYYISEDSNNNR